MGTTDKISDYLQGRVAQAQLVVWAERAIMDEELNQQTLNGARGKRCDIDFSGMASEGFE